MMVISGDEGEEEEEGGCFELAAIPLLGVNCDNSRNLK